MSFRWRGTPDRLNDQKLSRQVLAVLRFPFVGPSTSFGIVEL